MHAAADPRCAASQAAARERVRDDDPVDYDPTQFQGTAPHYLRGRPPYSAQLPAVLARELGLDGHGRLIDVGSGPGTLGVVLAPLFDHVAFVEPDADMLAAARAHASNAGLSAVDFVGATAEQLATLQLEPARVVSFGQSFHRTDRQRAADAAYDTLEPGGSIVLVAHDPTRPAPVQPANTALIPHDEILALIRTYLGAELRSGARPVSSYDTERFEDTLRRTRFGRPRIVTAAGQPDIVRDVDSVVDNYLSMSFAAPPMFGDRLPRFVDELRALLLSYAPDGRFWDWAGDTEMVIATRPG